MAMQCTNDDQPERHERILFFSSLDVCKAKHSGGGSFARLSPATRMRVSDCYGSELGIEE